MQKNIYFFIGTSAELIKIAPIIKELQRRKIEFKLITSGQNKINFEDLTSYIDTIRSSIAFKEKENKSSLFYFLLWAIRTLITGFVVLRKELKGLNKNNSYFIIHGDTISSSIGAILATFFGLKLVHIESGDLSFNLLEPFPEEICRNINIYLADVLFAPNSWAASNLRVKRVRGKVVNTRFNTLVESFWWALRKKENNSFVKKYKKYYILILHRQEHVIFRKNWSREILELVIKNADKNMNCVILNHPLTVAIIQSIINKSEYELKKRIFIIPRLPYHSFMKLMQKSEFIASDGCTNQLEAFLLGIPCLVLRDRTEQIEGVNNNVVIAESNKQKIKSFLKNYRKYRSTNILSKERPSIIIVDYLLG